MNVYALNAIGFRKTGTAIVASPNREDAKKLAQLNSPDLDYQDPESIEELPLTYHGPEGGRILHTFEVEG